MKLFVRTLLFTAGLFAATLLAYAPALRAGFIWNDSDYVTAPALRSLDGLARIWFELGATEQYYPILHSAFWLEHRLWGDSPGGYHLVNILLHAACGCVLAAVLRRLLAIAPATTAPGPIEANAALPWTAAFLFALHPVCVESVAWISEQKNTLSLLFYLLAALLYLRFDDGGTTSASSAFGRAARAEAGPPSSQPRARIYLAATFCFVLALLTKSTTAMLPPALLVVLWWRRGRLDWRRDIVPLLPWFLLAAAMGLFSAYVERKYIGAEGAEFALGPLQRTLLAGRIAWFYLGQLIWPGELIFIYPRWTVDPGNAGHWLSSLGAVALVAGLWALRRRWRGPLAAVLFFGGSLFPVLGFFNVYAFIFSFVADHWQYLPSLGIVVFAAGAIARRGMLLRLLIVLPLGVLTFHQSRMYADMRTFYRTTLARNPEAWMAHNNLGNLLREDGDFDGAIRHFEAALRVRPDLWKTHNNLASCLRDVKRPDEALVHYRRALELEPNYSDAHNNLGSLLRELGRTEEAIGHLLHALRIDPEYHDARLNLGMALRDAGQLTAALAHFERVVRAQPEVPAARLNLALTYSLLGREAEAMEHYREARRLNPAIPELPPR